MIIKGSSRGQTPKDTADLARHLLATENEQVRILQIQGLCSEQLPDALEEMRLLGAGTRTRRTVYHASINLDRTEARSLDDEEWLHSVNALEHQLGLRGHARAVVQHIKHGRPHIHIVWARTNPQTLKIASDAHNYRKHEECARALEARFGLKAVVGVHSRAPDTPRPVAQATHRDWQASQRTGVAVSSVSEALGHAWKSTSNGQEFADALRRQGIHLAIGRRGIIAIDHAGTPHSISRRMGVPASTVQARLQEIPDLPRLNDFSTRQHFRRHLMQDLLDNAPSISVSDSSTPFRQGDFLRFRKFWASLGYECAFANSILTVIFPNGTKLLDAGDKITLHRTGEPTDEEIRAMVTAGKERGWTSVRFSGGSPEFQRRARLEALRQGYQLHEIALECEENRAPLGLASDLPAHLKKRLHPRPVPSHTDEPDRPADTFRPKGF